MWLQRALEAKTSITNVGLRFKNNENDTLNIGARVLETMTKLLMLVFASNTMSYECHI